MESRLSKYLHARAARLGVPINGGFELTPRCNFNCPMCYVHLSAEEQKRRGRELTGDEWIEIAEKAKRAGTVFLLVTGGEPTLHPDFLKIYEHLSNMGLYFSLNSNGMLLEGEVLALLRRKPPARLNITLYATDNETYERQCGVPAYDRVVRNIRAVREAGISVRINLTMTPANQQEIDTMVAQAKELGAVLAGTNYLWPPVRVDVGLVGKNFRPEPEEAGRRLVEYDKLRMTRETYLNRAKRLLAGLPDEREPEDDCAIGMPMQCRAGKCAYWIDWQGNMTACAQMPSPSVNLLTTEFDAAWQQLRSEAAEIRLPPECAACGLQKICNPCAAKCYAETGSYHRRPDYVCRYTKSFLQAMKEDCEQEDEYAD